MQKTIEIPASLFNKISKAAMAFEAFEDEMEVFLLSKDSEFIEKMSRARKNHLAGKTAPLAKLKKELCIK